MEPVELRPAFQWTCPECGTDQFEAAIVVELSREEESELHHELGIEPGEGNWASMPDTVECRQCEREYPTLHFGDEETDEDLPGI